METKLEMPREWAVFALAICHVHLGCLLFSFIFRPITGFRILHSRFFSLSRSRIEQVVAILRDHYVIEGRPFRGDFMHLIAYVKIIAYATSVR